jgi:RNA ligase (TIGR02306 family)
MSQFSVPVIQLGKVGKHPNADTLSITTVMGCPVIFRTGDFVEGSLAIYVPVDAVVPKIVPGTEFLGDKRRIKAMKIRGIFSMGLLLPASLVTPDPYGNYPAIGDDMSDYLCITKYEEPEDLRTGTATAKAPKLPFPAPVYDIESWRKYGPFTDAAADEVVITEKLHGTNSRFVFAEGELHVGSHTQWKKNEPGCVWWRMARQYNLAEKLAKWPDFIFYGETYGAVQDLRYGHEKGQASLRFFDIYDANTGKWVDDAPFERILGELDLTRVPVLYHGPLAGAPDLDELAKGKSTIADNIREGIVIKPTEELWCDTYGRVILKLVGEDYLLRRGSTTEFH